MKGIRFLEQEHATSLLMNFRILVQCILVLTLLMSRVIKLEPICFQIHENLRSREENRSNEIHEKDLSSVLINSHSKLLSLS